ncbi:MAG: hypothetical protein HQL97_14990 [Magnetococcales bacterium]|nr:hypothetical protein [Magnetococcales bacterium]MBF0263133.1 hypothetical protein [Magnetococcales bacterium]
MTCRVDEILNDSRDLIRDTMLSFAEDLTTDFNLDSAPSQNLLESEAAKTLRGAMETFAVWYVGKKG